MPSASLARRILHDATTPHGRAAGITVAALVALSATACGATGSMSEATPTVSTRPATPVTTTLDLPTAASATTQPAPSNVGFDAPVIAGYGPPNATDVATSAGSTGDSPGWVTAATWSSRTTSCLITARVTTSSDLLISGADDRQLSRAAGEAALSSYPESSSDEPTEATIGSSTPYAGVSTAFTAMVDGKDADGRSFTRVWGADGAALQVAELCPSGAFDNAAWRLSLSGIEIHGVAGGSGWPGGEPTPSPTPSASPTAS